MFTLIMDVTNPYVVSILTGLCVYMFTVSSASKSDDKQTKQAKQTNLNYVFLSSITVFIVMHFYGSNNTELEPTLDSKFCD